MDRRQIGLVLALDQLGLPLKLATFDDRLVLQKAIYLAEAAGVHLGYDHSWYLRGPYSSGLARDAFAAEAELAKDKQEIAGWKLDDGSQQQLTELQDLVTGEQNERAKRLELLASTHYLVRRRGMSQDDLELLTQELQKRGKECDHAAVRDAIQQLVKHHLL